MKTLSASVEAMLASREATIARCMWVQLRNMDEMAFTDHDVELEIDLNLSSGGATAYRADVGVLPSNIELSIGLEPDSMEFTGPISDLVTRADVLGGVFNGARVRVFDIDWQDPSVDNIIALLGGRIYDARVLEDRFTFEVRSHVARFKQTIGRVLSPYCSLDFGDPDTCGVVRPEEAASVLAVTDALSFTVGLPTPRPDDYYNLGTVDFLNGPNGGVAEWEVFDFTGSTATVEFLSPLPALPQVGDQLIIRQGCSKIKFFPTDPTLRTCIFWQNARRFGGFDRVPGNDNFLKIASPGSNNT